MTDATAINCVVFDMDGVLCHTDFARRLEAMAQATGLTADAVDAAIFRSGFDDRADQGHYDADAYLLETGERLGVAISRADWLDARRAAMTPYPGMLALAQEMSGRLTTAMLTNNGPLLRAGFDQVFPEAVEVFGARAFFSSQLGAAKPDREVFHRLLAELDHAPAETLFIDDSADYIA
ncbi:MAG: HAD-IA family hydrolase, partial [Alphaproteobacteria bacterium]|nr:HAD-IA family hydrolase [Alphaproteobacteria bacterium]